MAEPLITKVCGKCRQDLPTSSFGRHRSILRSYCKACHRQTERDRRAASPEHVRALERRRRVLNPEKVRAKERRAGRKYYAKNAVALRTKETDRLKDLHRKAGRVARCPICSSAFCPTFGRHSWKDTCSPECRREVSRRKTARNLHIRRARIRGSKVAVIEVYEIFERDGWRCQLCGKPTPRAKRGTFDDDAPELDHVIPLARGGAHTVDNVQCACRVCNGRKGARLAA